MKSYLTPKTPSFCVANLRNSPTITCDSRLEPEYFRSPSTSFRINQSFHNFLGWALLLLLLFCVPRFGHAYQVSELYEANVVISDQQRAQRQQAIRQALKKVLIKITGDRQIAEHTAIKGMLRRAARFVQQYSYFDAPYESSTKKMAEELDSAVGQQPLKVSNDLDSRTEEGVEEGMVVSEPLPARLYLAVKFDRSLVNEVLIDQGIPVWGQTRPVILAWFATQQDNQRTLVGGDVARDIQMQIREYAKGRGVPIIFPLLDLEDQMNLEFADVWGHFSTVIKGASARYLPQAILVGRIDQRAGVWQGRWTLYQGEIESQWEGANDALLASMFAGVDESVDILSKRFAQVFSNEVEETVKIHVAAVRTLADYARTLKYFQSLDVLTDIDLIQTGAQSVVFKLGIRGSRFGLEQVVKLGDVLALADKPIIFSADYLSTENSDNIAQGALRYQLLP